jgi:diacylglycerol kinase (ATP)
LKTLFIINPRSGTPKLVYRVKDLIYSHLGRSNRNISVVTSRSGSHVEKLAREAVLNGVNLVVAVGGDGTVNSTAKQLINTDTALGVIPAGSGNGFARNMSIPLRLSLAVENICYPQYKTIDVGKVGDNIFLVSCGLGWEAMIATQFEESLMRGVIPYATISFSTFLQYEPEEFSIQTEPDGWKYSGKPLLFSVTNMREYGTGVTIAPDAIYDDGLLDICLLPRHKLLDTIKYTPEMFRQNINSIPGYIHHVAKKISVKRTNAGNIHLDGTPVHAEKDLVLEVVPLSLKVAICGEKSN